MHYYKFNVKSWVADTSHLLPEEEGIYLRLTNHYYDKEHSIPEDLIPTLRKLRLTAYRDMVDGILQEFFVLVNGYWIHKYCDKTLGKYHKNAEKNRINGALGGRPPLETTHSEPNGIPVATQTEPTLVNQEPLTTNHKPDKEAGVKTSTKSSPCPYQQIVDLYHEKLPMLPRVVTLSDGRKRAMKARWSNGASNMKFWMDYFDSVSESKFLTGHVDPSPGRKQFVADIDFLIRESTIIKTQEGKYHG